MRRKLSLQKPIPIKAALLILLTVSTMLTSCGRTSIYVLQQEELVKVKAGDSVIAKFDGWLLSNRAVSRVMNAKVEDVKLK